MHYIVFTAWTAGAYIYMEQFTPNIYPLIAENNNVVLVHVNFINYLIIMDIY